MSGFLELSLTEADMTYARQTLHEDDAAAVLDRFREWISRQTHFSCATEDKLLLVYLRICQYDEESTHKLLENHVRIRVTAPTNCVFVHENVLDPDTDDLLSKSSLFILPGQAKDGSRVMLYQVGDILENRKTLSAGLKAASLSIDVLMNDPVAQVRGITFLADHRNMHLSMLTHLRIPLMKMMADAFSNYGRLRFRSSHLLSTPWIMRGTIAVGKTFVSSDVAQNIHCHKKHSTHLFKFVPQDILPDYMGGTAGSLEQLGSHWYEHVKETLPQMKWLAEFSYGKSDQD